VVVPAEHAERTRELVGSRAGILVIVGGDSRQSSVAAGLDQIEAKEVIVHDGARPFLDPGSLQGILDGLEGFDGAIAAVPVDETLKRAQDSLVVETVDRAGVWNVQTPQAFVTASLKRAHARALQDGFVGTDDAALIERVGGRVRIVEGSRTNLKVTYPEDFALAEAYLRSRRMTLGAGGDQG
jgi:2-C-methyl-D-erythritol 4-phosphate cytidylyltransferase